MSEERHGAPAIASVDRYRGLAAIVEVLAAAGVRFWVDSGNLLGLRRDGQLLPWEKDIDLGVTATEIGGLLSAVGTYERLGYRAQVNRYRGVVWSVGLKPTSASAADDLRAAVHVFYEIGDHLWSPQPQIYVPPPAPDVFRGTRSLGGRIIQRAIDRWLYTSGNGARHGRVSRAPDRLSIPYRLARWCYRRLDQGSMAETWPLREIYVPLTWVLPTRLVLPLSEIMSRNGCMPAPADVDAYLTYRYGDWVTPVSDWCYWDDDGAIVHAPPLHVARRLRAGLDPRGAVQN